MPKAKKTKKVTVQESPVKKLSWASAGVLMKKSANPKEIRDQQMIIALSVAFDIPPQGITILADSPYINKEGWEFIFDKHKEKKGLSHFIVKPIELAKQAGDTAIFETRLYNKDGKLVANGYGSANAANIKMGTIKVFLNEMAETRSQNRCLRKVLPPILYQTFIDRVSSLNKEQTELVAEAAANFGSVTAEEIGATIYIGGQVVIDGPSSWNFVDRTWNEGFFNEVGDSADFYVIHDYFGSTYTVKALLNIAVSEPTRNMDYLKQNFIDHNTYPKPVALTEYNIGLNATSEQQTSYINGMQAVILISEMIKNNFGMAARWLLLSGETTMFYGGSDPNYLHHPHADFYYLTYLQKFYGDHAISAASTNDDILCYVSRYSSGETGVIIMNTDTEEQVIGVDMQSIGVGQNYYIYSFTGGTQDGDFSPYVAINGYGSDTNHWGPYSELFDIPANSYLIVDEIKFTSPGRSVQMIMIEGGDNYVSVNDEVNAEMLNSFILGQNYPNPFNPSTIIRFTLSKSSEVTLTIYSLLGQGIQTLLNQEMPAGKHQVEWNAKGLATGIYYYRLEAGNNIETRKMVVIK